MATVDIEEFNRILEYLKADLEIIKRDKYHERCHDLLNMVMYEEVPALIQFVEKVNKAFSVEIPEATGDQYRGFKCAIETLKRVIYGK